MRKRRRDDYAEHVRLAGMQGLGDQEAALASEADYQARQAASQAAQALEIGMAPGAGQRIMLSYKVPTEQIPSGIVSPITVRTPQVDPAVEDAQRRAHDLLMKQQAEYAAKAAALASEEDYKRRQMAVAKKFRELQAEAKKITERQITGPRVFMQMVVSGAESLAQPWIRKWIDDTSAQLAPYMSKDQFKSLTNQLLWDAQRMLGEGYGNADIKNAIVGKIGQIATSIGMREAKKAIVQSPVVKQLKEEYQRIASTSPSDVWSMINSGLNTLTGRSPDEAESETEYQVPQVEDTGKKEKYAKWAIENVPAWAQTLGLQLTPLGTKAREIVAKELRPLAKTGIWSQKELDSFANNAINNAVGFINTPGATYDSVESGTKWSIIGMIVGSALDKAKQAATDAAVSGLRTAQAGAREIGTMVSEGASGVLKDIVAKGASMAGDLVRDFSRNGFTIQKGGLSYKINATPAQAEHAGAVVESMINAGRTLDEIKGQAAGLAVGSTFDKLINDFAPNVFNKPGEKEGLIQNLSQMAATMAMNGGDPQQIASNLAAQLGDAVVKKVEAGEVDESVLKDLADGIRSRILGVPAPRETSVGGLKQVEMVQKLREQVQNEMANAGTNEGYVPDPNNPKRQIRINMEDPDAKEQWMRQRANQLMSAFEQRDAAERAQTDAIIRQSPAASAVRDLAGDAVKRIVPDMTKFSFEEAVQLFGVNGQLTSDSSLRMVKWMADQAQSNLGMGSGGSSAPSAPSAPSGQPSKPNPMDSVRAAVSGLGDGLKQAVVGDLTSNLDTIVKEFALSSQSPDTLSQKDMYDILVNRWGYTLNQAVDQVATQTVPKYIASIPADERKARLGQMIAGSIKAAGAIGG